MAMDEQLKMVKRREVELLGTQRLKSKAEEVCRRLQEDIQRIKEQKVRRRQPGAPELQRGLGAQLQLQAGPGRRARPGPAHELAGGGSLGALSCPARLPAATCRCLW